MARLRLAHVQQWRGDFVESNLIFTELLAVAAQFGPVIEAFTHQHAGMNDYDQGHWDDARAHFERALAIRDELELDEAEVSRVALDAAVRHGKADNIEEAHDRERARHGGRPRAGRCRRRGRRGRACRCPARPARWHGCGSAKPARLATSLVVREDSLTLYGFADDDERALFELLQTANGVGPKLAQTMLAVHPPRELRRAIATSDYTSLTAVPGIGRKGAERIVVELRDRIGSIDGSDGDAVPLGVTPVAPWRDQLAHALAGLGFSGKEAGDAIEVVAADAGDAPDVSVLLRKSIQLLGRTGDERWRRAGRDERCARAWPTSELEPMRSDLVNPLPVLAERDVEASAAAQDADRVRRPGQGARATRSSCSSRRCGATGRPTTSCSPDRPGWARPASR